MTTQQLSMVFQLANDEAQKLTLQMNIIFAQHPECEAPEFMPEGHSEEWMLLWKLRRGIFDRMARVEQAAHELSNYVAMEIV